ncbi:hypothetical protein TNCV_718621 [Trichonephila clavipes]|nr:hypothetical protein TNCV_718621 [Trichonephila clavipes]
MEASEPQSLPERYVKILSLFLALSAIFSTCLPLFPSKSKAKPRKAVILAPDKGCVETSWKSACGTDADTAIGNVGVQMLVKLLELERRLQLDHVSALVSLSQLLMISESLFELPFAYRILLRRAVWFILKMNSDSKNECLIEERSSNEEFSSSESESDDDCLDSARDWCQI